MLFLFILLNQILCQKIFQQQGRINDTYNIQFNISKEEKLMLEQNQLRFDFKFDFPTLIKFEISNRTLNIKEEIILESPQAQIGYLISNDFFLFQRNLTIIIEPLTEYKQQWYRYDIRANLNQQALTRFQPEAGIANSSQAIYYNLNLTYETTGFYQIDISFQQGKGEMFLKQCVDQNCTEQNNQSKIQLNYSQLNCIEISKHQFKDLCNHELKIIAQKGTSYFLTFKHITTADVQFIRPNQVEQIQLKNKEASLLLGSQSELNFLYSNQIIKGIQFCPENRKSFESQIYIFSNQACQITEDWDQNFYIQHPNSSQLKLQYINQIDVFYINSVHRLQQEKDSYYFFCIETIFQEVQFQIFVFDFELLVQIYFSNTTQYPNENENQFELIESNYKTLQIYNNNRMYIGIKTKQENLEYEISIKDSSLNFLNLFQELDVKYCQSCSQEHRFEAKTTQLLFLHIFLDQIENQIESPQFSIIIINNGRVLKQKEQFVQKSYIRIIFDVQVDETYIFVTRSKVQQNVRLLLSDFRFLQLNQVGEMNVQYKKEEIYRIKKNQKNTFFFYFFIDVQRQIKFNNLQGTCEYEQISNNYFEVIFKNSQREDGYTYFNLEGIDEEQTFLISSKMEENIDKLSDSIFIDPMKIEQRIDSLIITSKVANCQLINCDLFSNISTFLQIEYSNQTKILINGYSNLSEYNQVLDQFYQPFQKLRDVSLKVQVPYKEKYYNFTSEKQRFIYKELNLDSKKDNNFKYFSIFYAFLYLVAIVILGYIAIKMIFRKQVKAKLLKNIMKRRKDFTEEEEQIKVDDI